MISPQCFIVKPKEEKYKTELISGVCIKTSMSIENAKDVSKKAIVVSTPLMYDGEIEKGDEVLIHHNIFREFYGHKGKVTRAFAYLFDDLYQIIPEELFAYKKDGQWKANLDFCFVEPIKNYSISNIYSGDLKHTGRIRFSNFHKTNNPVLFTPESEYEVNVDGEILYRMRDKNIMLYDRLSM